MKKDEGTQTALARWWSLLASYAVYSDFTGEELAFSSTLASERVCDPVVLRGSTKKNTTAL